MTSPLVPPVVLQIVLMAQERIGAERVYLFGSRAKGTANPKSDIDLAFVPNPAKEIEWSRFVADVEEEAATLLELDLVNLARCPAELRNEILATGIQLL